MLYLRFAFCLAFGLGGVALFLITVMDTVLVDWDVIADIKEWFYGISHHKQPRYVHLEPVEQYAVRKSAYEREFLGGTEKRRFPRRTVDMILPIAAE